MCLLGGAAWAPDLFWCFWCRFHTSPQRGPAWQCGQLLSTSHGLSLCSTPLRRPCSLKGFLRSKLRPASGFPGIWVLCLFWSLSWGPGDLPLSLSGLVFLKMFRWGIVIGKARGRDLYSGLLRALIWVPLPTSCFLILRLSLGTF